MSKVVINVYRKLKLVNMLDRNSYGTTKKSDSQIYYNAIMQSSMMVTERFVFTFYERAKDKDQSFF